MARRFFAEDIARNNDGVHIEMEPVDIFSQYPGASTSRFPGNMSVPSDNYNYHTIPRSLVEQLPSRSLDVSRKPSSHGSVSAHETLRIRTVSIFKDLPEDDVIQILENDPKIEDLDELAAGKHKEATLKQLHYSLTGKRKVKARLDKRASKLHKKVGCVKQMKYSLSMKWYKFKNGLKESLSSLELWKKPLHIIEGKFGTSVASYFYLLRWLLRLNVLTFLIQFSFVTVPQMLVNFFPDVQKYPLLCQLNSSLIFVRNATEKVQFSPEILLTGGGWLEHSWFYYGGYSKTILSLSNSGVSYNIPLAYLAVIGVNVVLVLIFMSIKLAKSYKERFIEHSGLKMNFFSNKVFCGWDFAITNPKAAELHSACLRLDLIEYLSQLQKRAIIRTVGEKTIRFFRVLLFHLLAFAVLGLTGWLIFYLLNEKYLMTDIKVLGEMSLSLTVVLVTLIVPSLLTYMVKFEGYQSRRTQLWVNMMRCLLLIAVIIGILLSFWVPNLSFINDILQNNEFNKRSCWETQVGMEIYRLVVMDFVVCGVLYFFTFWMKSALYKSGFKYLGTEFDVAWNFWNLLYNQVLGWIGSFFCPLLPLLIIIKMVLTFYIKQWSLRLHAQPAEQTLRAQNSQTIFLIISFLALVCSFLANGYIIIQVTPSIVCGPFSGNDYPYSIIFCIAESFYEYEAGLGQVVAFITKPGCVVIVIIFLCCVTYYSRALAAANLKMMTLLRQQVVLEGKDKVFLLRMFDTSLRDWHRKAGSMNSLDSKHRAEGILIEASNSGLSSSFPSERFEPRFEPRIEPRTEPRTDSPKPTEFPRKRSTPTEHRILADFSPGSNRKRKMSSPADGDPNRSSAHLYSYRSQESLHYNPQTNPAFREDSPLKSKSKSKSAFAHDPLGFGPLPGVTHQPPFQHLNKYRRSSNHQSQEDLKSIRSKSSR